MIEGIGEESSPLGWKLSPRTLIEIEDKLLINLLIEFHRTRSNELRNPIKFRFV